MPKKGKKGANGGMTKSQMKKLERKRQLEQEQALKARVQTANIDEATGKARNVLADFVPFQAFSRNGLDATLEFHTASSMVKTDLDWVCDLTARNMAALYEASDWGWKPKEKREELTHDDARYIIVRAKAASAATREAAEAAGAEAPPAEGTPLAFIHFRFELEGEVEVLYVYDVQLEPAARRKKLGKHLMLVMELCARKWQMQWVMLTVFKNNQDSMSFFSRLGYEIDDTSPSVCYAPTMPESQVDYEILSKPMDRSTDRTKPKAVTPVWTATQAAAAAKVAAGSAAVELGDATNTADKQKVAEPL
eukprot:g1648.t1